MQDNARGDLHATALETARGLSEAQRAAVLDGLARYMDPNTVRALRRKGLVEPRSIMLTMNGLALRALLKDNTNGNG